MKKRDSFRGTAITKAFCEAFKSTKFYTEIYQKHKNEIIIGIRNGYINLYYNCDSIAKIRVGQPSKAQLEPYYTDKKTRSLSDEEYVSFYNSIKEKSDRKDKKEKQAQERLFIDNNSNPSSAWFCIDVEFTKSLRGKNTAKDWRFDIIAISKVAPFRVALIELKYDKVAIRGKSGVRTHVRDFYTFHKENRYENLKDEIVSIVKSLQRIGVDVPYNFAEISTNKFAIYPEFYFIMINNNAKAGASTPEQTMSGQLFKDKGWNCKKISKPVIEEGDYFTLTENDKDFKPIFLFSSATLPNINIQDILDFDNYNIIHSYPYDK